jgi:hypothetical protein
MTSAPPPDESDADPVRADDVARAARGVRRLADAAQPIRGAVNCCRSAGVSREPMVVITPGIGHAPFPHRAGVERSAPTRRSAWTLAKAESGLPGRAGRLCHA